MASPAWRQRPKHLDEVLEPVPVSPVHSLFLPSPIAGQQADLETWSQDFGRRRWQLCESLDQDRRPDFQRLRPSTRV